MKIPTFLANRLLRNANRHEASAQLYLGWPASLPYSPPLPIGTHKVAAIGRGDRAYDLLQETPLSITEVEAFYINRLRLAGWQYYSKERRDGIALTGLIRTLQLSPSHLSFFHPGQNLVLRLHFVESGSQNTFLLSIEDAAQSAELSIAACHTQLNLVPVPMLLPIAGGQYCNGSSGGDNHTYREVRLLESTQPLAQAFAHYRHR